MGDLELVEGASSIQRTIADEFEEAAMDPIGAGLRHDDDLSSRSLPILSPIGVRQQVELAHGIDAEHVAADAPWCYRELVRAGVLNAVHKEQVVLRQQSADGKRPARAGRRVRRLERRVVDRPGLSVIRLS